MIDTKFVEDLVTCFSTGDTGAATKLIEKEIRRARSVGHVVVAKRLTNLLKSIPQPTLSAQSARTREVTREVSFDHQNLFEKIYSNVPIEDVVLDGAIRNAVSSFLIQWEAFDSLAARNVFPINKLIFYGPPGTGKTKLAYGIAHKLDLPLVIVRLDELISSFLGKTGKNIREIFDIARSERCVIFLDEIDTIAKHRDDSKELGELKRVVTVLLQNIDDFPVSSILIGATNHEELLDKALWRRFGLKLKIELPTLKARELMFEVFLAEPGGKTPAIDYALLANITDGMSGSFINDIALSIKRSSIIENREIDTSFALKHLMAYSSTFSGTERLNKKSSYLAGQKLKDAGFTLLEIAEISGIPYTTLRDNLT